MSRTVCRMLLTVFAASILTGMLLADALATKEWVKRLLSEQLGGPVVRAYDIPMTSEEGVDGTLHIELATPTNKALVCYSSSDAEVPTMTAWTQTGELVWTNSAAVMKSVVGERRTVMRFEGKTCYVTRTNDLDVVTTEPESEITNLVEVIWLKASVREREFGGYMRESGILLREFGGTNSLYLMETVISDAKRLEALK